MSPKDTAKMDQQMKQGSEVIARSCWSLFVELCAVGFNEQAALALTSEWMKTTFAPIRGVSDAGSGSDTD